MLKCPECGSNLELLVDVVCTHGKKIKKDGSLYKKTNFSYDVEHGTRDKRIPEIDEWITTHLDEIYELR